MYMYMAIIFASPTLYICVSAHKKLLISTLLNSGEAGAIMAKAIARAQALETLGKAIGREHGSKAASLSVAEQYVQAFSQLAKSTNTLLLPEKTGDISSMVAQVSSVVFCTCSCI